MPEHLLPSDFDAELIIRGPGDLILAELRRLRERELARTVKITLSTARRSITGFDREFLPGIRDDKPDEALKQVELLVSQTRITPDLGSHVTTAIKEMAPFTLTNVR